MSTDIQQKEKAFLHKQLTEDVIGAAFAVHNELGCGLLEKVYENALVVELGFRGRSVVSQMEFPVLYRGTDVGAYFADAVVDEAVIVEVKAVERLAKMHEAQLLHYLKISGLRVGLLLNFAKTRLEFERRVV